MKILIVDIAPYCEETLCVMDREVALHMDNTDYLEPLGLSGKYILICSAIPSW